MRSSEHSTWQVCPPGWPPRALRCLSSPRCELSGAPSSLDPSSWLHAWPVTGSSTYMFCACRNDTGYGTWVSGSCTGEAGTELSQTSGSLLLPECAKVFHAVGAKLVLCGRNREALEQLAKELAASRASEVSPRARLLGRRVSPSSAEIVAPGLLDGVPVQVAAGRHSSCSAAGQTPHRLLALLPPLHPAGTCPALLLGGTRAG